jgi:hypothetical protein
MSPDVSVDTRATIHYRRHGHDYTWCIGAHRMKDHPESLRAHLARWIPDAEFLGVTFESEQVHQDDSTCS